MRLNLIFSELMMNILLGWRAIFKTSVSINYFKSSILIVLTLFFIRGFKLTSSSELSVLSESIVFVLTMISTFCNISTICRSLIMSSVIYYKFMNTMNDT